MMMNGKVHEIVTRRFFFLECVLFYMNKLYIWAKCVP